MSKRRIFFIIILLVCAICMCIAVIFVGKHENPIVIENIDMETSGDFIESDAIEVGTESNNQMNEETQTIENEKDMQTIVIGNEPNTTDQQSEMEQEDTTELQTEAIDVHTYTRWSDEGISAEELAKITKEVIRLYEDLNNDAYSIKNIQLTTDELQNFNRSTFFYVNEDGSLVINCHLELTNTSDGSKSEEFKTFTVKYVGADLSIE